MRALSRLPSRHSSSMSSSFRKDLPAGSYGVDEIEFISRPSQTNRSCRLVVTFLCPHGLSRTRTPTRPKISRHTAYGALEHPLGPKSALPVEYDHVRGEGSAAKSISKPRNEPGIRLGVDDGGMAGTSR